MTVELSRLDEFAVVTLNRPDALNALSFSMLQELARVLVELALACTFRLATRSARMGQPEIKLGLIPGSSASRARRSIERSPLPWTRDSGSRPTSRRSRTKRRTRKRDWPPSWKSDPPTFHDR